ncbi:hypothetical protein COM49_11850 [Bacillus pseudomycoides]|nr:hypothetical protein COO06_20570 [Bacillus pseudomycoides]PGD92531.1 hypothetical protein COM50_21905 [Bacillus pseudomycoides]PGE02965.1 hypothetical protein COM49_11850 [Bacillus pseudomycoides]PHE69450.1 hypothetical protein COF69_10120 [Bacillus pseudomycoides]PHG16918.1 hypothetical protein COI47_24530 [Bacillus pseudomycoides]
MIPALKSNTLPGNYSQELHKRYQQAVPIGVYNLTPLYVQSEKEAMITDVDGNNFIDFAGGIGAMELVTDHVTKEPAKELTAQLIKEFWENGLISIGAGIHDNVLRFLPPLVISNEEIDKGFEIINQAFEALCQNSKRSGE